jgi:ppGpp synthetase/RelA/SpoT-type nucleotidyltranferase
VNESRSDEEWADFYADQRGIYDAFVDRLEDLLETLLDEDDVEYGWVSSFSHSPDEFVYALNRARRAGQTFDNPLESPLRVAGVEVGVATLVPVPQIVDLIRREFVVDPAGSLSIEEATARTEQLARPDGSDGLAYEFPHYLISLDERRLELAEWSRFAGVKVRIEVKTQLQDTWEGIDLDFPFFTAAAYPAEVRDLLARSALGLSAIDADLEEAKDAMSRLLAEYEEAVAAGDLQLPVNGVSLLAYTRTSELVRSLTELGEDVGLTPEPDDALGWAAIRDLLWLLRSADVHTVAELEDFLKQATPRARDTLAEFVHVATDRGFTPWAGPDHILEWLWLVLRRADAGTISLLRYAEEIAYALNTLIGNPVPADEPEAT